MAGTYKCPRCGGDDIYFAKRQKITGVGGIYGNQARMVRTALCRNCGENADFTPDKEDVRKLYKIIVLVVLGVSVLVILAVSIQP